MISVKHFCSATVAVLAFVGATSIAYAQESTASPAPAETSQPTFMDRQYDGKTHVMVAPYIWGPTVKANFQFSVPRLARRHRDEAGPIASNIEVGPSQYLPKLNTAAMAAFDLRKGEFDIFGDGIYLNATTTATIFSTITGPRGIVQIPLTINSSAHLSTAIWEVAAGYTVAHGHDADLSIFAGVREFPITLNVDYTATIGKRGIVAPTGSLTTSDYTNDIIWGLRGRAFFGNDHLYVPYYFDVGQGTNNQTWQAYGGAGYAFNHGQTFVALWRALNYNEFPPTAHVQKMSLAGPLLGYTFNI
jgi:hypothetical protein